MGSRPNRPEWIPCAFAIAGLGATAVTVNTWATAKELEYLLEHSDSCCLIASPRYLKADYGAMLGAMWPGSRLPMLQAIVGVGDELPAGWLALRADGPLSTEDERKIQATFEVVKPHDVALMVYTSGSTSRPKGVQLQHYALIENNWNIGERMHVTSSDRLWMAISLFWSLGCANAMLNLLTHGGCIVLQEHFDETVALRLMEQERCTVYYGTANIGLALAAHPELSKHDLSSLRTGGAAGTPEQLQRVRELGASKICNVYGLSETYGFTHLVDADEPNLRKRLETVGKILPGFEARIVKEDGAEALPGESGELRVKGYVTPGYYKDPAQTQAAFDDAGFFRTGDQVSLDSEGYMRFLGRLKELVRSGGILISPAEVEDALMSHPEIELAQVISVPDARLEEAVAAVVVKTPGSALTAASAIDHCKGRLAAYKVPRHVRFAQEADLPLTTTGKVQKNRIAATFFADLGA